MSTKMSSILEQKDLPEWLTVLPPFPVEWKWRVGHKLRAPAGGIYHSVWKNNPLRQFDHESMRLEHTKWFFERGVYAIVQPCKTEFDGGRTIYGLALYQLKPVEQTLPLVYHVTLRENLLGIRRDGVQTGRHAKKCTSSWQEATDFVHVWRTREQARAWPNNTKLKEVTSGPWSIVAITPASTLYEDPKSDPGGLIFGTGYCAPVSCIKGTADI